MRWAVLSLTRTPGSLCWGMWVMTKMKPQKARVRAQRRLVVRDRDIAARKKRRQHRTFNIEHRTSKCGGSMFDVQCSMFDVVVSVCFGASGGRITSGILAALRRAASWGETSLASLGFGGDLVLAG